MALNSYIPSIYPQQQSFVPQLGVPQGGIFQSSIPSIYPQQQQQQQSSVLALLNSSASTPSQKAWAQQVLSRQGGGFSVVPSMGGQASSSSPQQYMEKEYNALIPNSNLNGIEKNVLEPSRILGGGTDKGTPGGMSPGRQQQQTQGGALRGLPAGGTGQQMSMPQIGGNIPGGGYTGGNISYAPPQQGQQGQPMPQGGALQMQQSPQAGLDAYKQTAGYQLLNAPGAFQASPGYQYAVNDALQQVQGQASARGLLESGAALRGMTDRAQGMAQQDYGNWWNRQNQQFTDYQNRLAGLAGGNVGADMAMQRGMAQGAGTMQAGGDIGSLFGGQGAAGYGGLMNTGAAQSGNINTAGAQQAQIEAANQSTQLSGQVYNRGLF